MFEIKAFAYTTTSLVIGLMLFWYCADRDRTARIGRRMLPLMVATQAAAFLSPNLVVYNVIAGIALFVACPDRRTIAPLYLFLLVTLPMASDVVAAGGVYILSYNVQISLGIAALIALAVRGKGTFARSMAWDIPVVLLLILFIFANGRSTSATNILRVSLEQASLFLLPYLVISRSIRSFDDLMDAMYGVAAGTTVLSVLAIYEALHTWPLYRVVSDHYGLVLTGDASVKVRAGFLRSAGPFTEPTSFGFCLALGMLAAIGSPRLFANRSRRAIVVAVMAVGILAPQSRGAWIGLAAGLVMMNLYDGRYGALARKALIACLGVVTVLAAAKLDERIASTAGLNAEGQGTVEYRSNLMDRGMETIRLNPVWGDSMDNVRFRMRDMTQGEGIIDFVNTYLFVALSAGLVGLAVFMFSLFFPAAMLWRAKAQIHQRFRGLFQRVSSASIVFGSLMACLMMISATSMTGRTTMLISIYIGLSSVILNNMRVARRGAGLSDAAEKGRRVGSTLPA